MGMTTQRLPTNKILLLIMRKISINNFGPIIALNIYLNKINIFIGPQSSGKSTLSKIISFCSWLEKECIINQNILVVDEDFINKNLFLYHRLSGYANSQSFFKYETDAVTIEYKNRGIIITKGDHFYDAVAHKTSYIPAERIVASIPFIRSFDMANNNLRSFLFDWWKMASNYSKENVLELPHLGTSYYYNAENHQDKILLRDGKDLEMSMASSGIQSIVPLFAHVKYATEWVYEHEEEVSYQKKELENAAVTRMMLRSQNNDADEELIDEYIRTREIPDFSVFMEKIKHYNEELNQLDPSLQTFVNQVKNVMLKHYSNIVVEEPELNVFPQTQIDLLYDLLRLYHPDRDNLFITTHSPYILYAINNCMLSYLVKDKLFEPEIFEALDFKGVQIDPKTVSVWEFVGGKLVGNNLDNGTIQDSSGLIRKNYFDSVMGNIMTDFDNLLSLYEDPS